MNQAVMKVVSRFDPSAGNLSNLVMGSGEMGEECSPSQSEIPHQSKGHQEKGTDSIAQDFPTKSLRGGGTDM